MELENIDTKIQSMRLRDALVHWAGCIGVYAALQAATTLANVHLGIIGTVILYLCFGIYLNRVVLRRLGQWHPVYNTLANVTGSKVRYVLFWPIAYSVLFLRMAINKAI